MSKIGKKPIEILEGIEVKINGGELELKGKKGEMSVKILPYVKIEIKDNQILFDIQVNSKQARANWGTIRSLVQNAVLGLNEGFTKILEINGVGYRAEMQGDDLILNIGLSHSVKVSSPENIKISVEKNIIKVFGVDKSIVGEIAAKIRACKKPEPYKGKGIRYQGEVVQRKAGKKVAGTAT
ncbi:MAG TPA: 50S ribosomal protein L6 [Candidatus Wolfebacteria bacterium]|nr:50S ribosomal protein L6 [Candidatus Wolfebacteria bacterium]